MTDVKTSLSIKCKMFSLFQMSGKQLIKNLKQSKLITSVTLPT